MSTISRLKVWVAGDLLLSADLNGEFNNIVNDYNGSIDDTNLGTMASTVLWTVSTNVVGIRISKTGVGAGQPIYITNQGTGDGIDIETQGDSKSIVIDQDGNGIAIDIDNSGTQDSLQLTTSGGGHGINFTTSGAGRDVDGTSSNWFVTSAGDATFNSVTIGAGAFTPTNLDISGVFRIEDSGNDHWYTFGVSDLAADRTATLPLLTGNDTFVFEAHIQTLTNKTITSPNIGGTVSGGATYSSVTLTTPTVASFANATHDHTNAAGGGALDINNATTGTLAVGQGGTGATTLTSNGVVVGNGTSAVTVTAEGSNNTVLHGNTGADPTFSAVDLTADVTGSLPVANGGTGVTGFGLHAACYYRDGSAGVPNFDHNIDSVGDDDGDGRYIINWDTNFSDADYVVVITFSVIDGGDEDIAQSITTQSAGTCDIFCNDVSTGGADHSFHAIAYGTSV